jgi:hypothetical protein
LDDPCGILRSLEISLEDCLVPPFPNIPASSHESCLPLRVGISVPTLVEVCKNLIPAINGKKLVIQYEGTSLIYTRVA